jgi:hypothetical protein
VLVRGAQGRRANDMHANSRRAMLHAPGTRGGDGSALTRLGGGKGNAHEAGNRPTARLNESVYW